MQFFHIAMWVPVLSNGIHCSVMCALLFYIYILYKVHLHTPIGVKVYRYTTQSASISLLFLSSFSVLNIPDLDGKVGRGGRRPSPT
jgi:hypothetical protein